MSKPEGVRILRPDGEVVECDDLLIHEGVDEDGLDHWRIPPEVNFRPGMDELTCQVFPGRTSIGLSVLADEIPPGAVVTWQERPRGWRWLFGSRKRRQTFE